MRSQNGIAQHIVMQFTGQRIPCSKVLPLAIKRNYSYGTCFLRHLVIKAYLGKLSVSGTSIFYSIRR